MIIVVIAYWSEWNAMVPIDSKGDRSDESCLGRSSYDIITESREVKEKEQDNKCIDTTF